MLRQDFDAVAAHVRNWGRWGKDDVRGSLNHIGPEALKNAAAEIRDGKMFSLSLSFDKDGPQNDVYRFNPKLTITQVTQHLDQKGVATMSDDKIEMPLQAATQWDAFSHMHYEGEMYNGCKVCDSISETGATQHGVEHLANPGIVARGVLLDAARYFKAERLEPGHTLKVDDLCAILKAQNTDVRPGDIVLVRTGHIRHFTIDKNRDAFHGDGAGLHAECAGWLYDVNAAAVAADNVAVERVEMAAFAGDGKMPMPLHMLCLRDMGMPLGEMFDMEALAADCAADGRYTFMLTAPPLAFTGAVGSPVNPIALK
jgi:kynurenine formamidase